MNLWSIWFLLPYNSCLGPKTYFRLKFSLFLLLIWGLSYIWNLLILPLKKNHLDFHLLPLSSFLCYGVGPCWLSVLNIVVCSSEKAMATHSSVIAWRIPGTGEPGGLPSMGSHSRTRLKRLSSSSSSQSYGFSSMYGCESWTIKKAEHRRIDAFEL